MELLLTVAEFADFRNISKKIDENLIIECISQAQQSDFMEILGEFYFDVLKNKDNPDYSELLDGCEFQYNNYDYEHVGLKNILADYAHARYVVKKNTKDTPFGYVVKDSNDSLNVDRNTLRDISKQDQIDAGNKFKFVDIYIKSKHELFTRYCKKNDLGTSFFFQRFSKL